MDRKAELLFSTLFHAKREDLHCLPVDEAIYQLLSAILNPRTPRPIHECRRRWVNQLQARYYSGPELACLDIVCFTFALRHFEPDLLELLNGGIPDRTLLLIQQAVAGVFQAPKASTSALVFKALPWGDVAQFVCQADWAVEVKFTEGMGNPYLGEVSIYSRFETNPVVIRGSA